MDLVEVLYTPLFRQTPKPMSLVPVGQAVTQPREPQQASLFALVVEKAPGKNPKQRKPTPRSECPSVSLFLVTPSGQAQTRDQFLHAFGDPRPTATCVSLATCVACDFFRKWEESEYETDWERPDAEVRSFTHTAQLLETRGVRDRAVNDAHKVISATKIALSALLPEPMDAGHSANLRRVWASHAADPEGGVNRLLGIGYLGLLGDT